MYQYNDRLTQLFTKYKYIWLWLQCFDPYLGHRQAYIMNFLLPLLQVMNNTVNHTGSRLARKTGTCTTLSKFII
jgi:hypothetical protein